MYIILGSPLLSFLFSVQINIVSMCVYNADGNLIKIPEAKYIFVFVFKKFIVCADLG